MIMNRTDMEINPDVASPAMGLNDNLNFLGKELHVQTENVQSDAPCIRTQVFFHGRVVHTVKYEYSNDLKNSLNLTKIRDRMHKQHRNVIEKIHRQQLKYRKRS